MADSKPATYTAPVLVASTADPVKANAKLISLWITAFTPLAAFVASRFLPAPRLHDDR